MWEEKVLTETLLLRYDMGIQKIKDDGLWNNGWKVYTVMVRRSL